MKGSPGSYIKHILMVLLVVIALAGLACGAAATPAPTGKAAPEAAATSAIPVPTPTPVSERAFQPAKVTRLIFASSPASHETNRIWAGQVGTLPDPLVETLIDLDPKTGAFTPRLADKWEMTPDGKAWTFGLHKGIPFHFGFGEFTARDVVHTHSLITRPDSIATYIGFWRDADRLEVVIDHQLVFHMKKPATAMPYLASRSGDLMILSKAQWDKEGVDGIDKRLAGTGPYQYVERRLGQSISFERVENHWRGEKPAFKELEIRWVAEDATRLAMLLTDEAHLADLPRGLQQEALKKGMRVIPSQLPTSNLLVAFGGQYHIKGDPSYKPDVPWNDKRVRQAMNLAINRKELLAEIFDGQGTLAPVHIYHPASEGWNPDWERRFDGLYGYNPAKAKALLAQAGYSPGAIKVKGALFAFQGLPEMPQVMEALQVYFHEVGIQMELEQTDFARFREARRKKEIHCCLFPGSPGFGPVEERLRTWYSSKGFIHAFQDDFIEEKYLALAMAVDPKERDRLAREMGDHLFENFSTIPLYWLFVQAVVNPKVVAEWTFPGTAAGRWSHWALLKAAK